MRRDRKICIRFPFRTVSALPMHGIKKEETMRSTLISAALASAAILAAAPLVAQDNSGRPLTTSLEGANEAPRLGDPDGIGSATIRINPGQRQLCYSLQVSGIASATAAHIHEAPAGTAGPVVIALQAPSGGSSSACVTISRELALEIIRDPSDYYVNVHNAEFPGGALRGQLSL
ncbi:MAG: CHRD domain-containing protein [Sphingomicrobium sp.]